MNWFQNNLPKDWQTRKLKRVTTLRYGDSLAVDDREDGDVPVYGSNGVVGSHSVANLQAPGLVVGRKGSYGKVSYTTDPAFVIDTAYAVDRACSREDLRWLYYALSSSTIDQKMRDSPVPGLASRDAYAIDLPLPPIAEQQRIAAYLDASCAAIDRAVETKRKQLETLDALRKSIIQKAVTQGLNPKVKMKDSGAVHLGPVPQHWEVRRIKDVFEFHNHRRIPISSAERGVMTDRIYDYYGASGAIDKVEGFIFEGRYILLAEDGANLLSRSKPLAFFAEGKFWVNNHAHIIKPWRGNEIYWVHLLEAMDYSLAVTGSAQPKLNMQNFGRFQIPVPPIAEQNEIADFVAKRSADCDKVTDTLTTQLATLTAYRKSLIHECVTGKRRISEADVAKVEAHV